MSISPSLDPTGRRAVVIGAGPAGLTAAYELVRHGMRPIVVEKQDHVGGLARTANYKGYHFDMGGHRFFTKAREVQRLWQEVLGEEFLVRPRLSRIYYNRTFFHYPLRAMNAFRGLGLVESLRIGASYLWWQVFPYRHVDTFEQWVTNRFGRRLFRTFFETYTEKVWGISCSELKAEWAAQRIKDLSLRTALLNMFRRPGTTIRTLIEEFHYPRLGPGMMWNAMREAIVRQGGVVRLDSEVLRVRCRGRRVEAVVVRDGDGQATITGTDFISSMPLRELIERLDPPAPAAVQKAAAQLTYRDFLTVCLVIDRAELFPDNWIYVHDTTVRAGRIQNFKNWSPAMVPDPTRTSLGLEYFCNEGDDLWRMPDEELVAIGRREIEQIGLAGQSEVVDGCVVRVPKAYPVYDSAYREYLQQVREHVEGLENFQTIGRNGLHRYNNQDHAMLTGMVAVRNLVYGTTEDVWSINTDEAYHEEVVEELPLAVEPSTAALEHALSRVFTRVDRTALGVALGTAGALLLFLATLAGMLRPEHPPGNPLWLLGQVFPGYRAGPRGLLLGLVYGFLTGFAAGWCYAAVRNATAFLYVALVHRRAERRLLRRLLDYI